MKYELWQMVQFSENENLVPFFKLKESENYYDVYEYFLSSIKKFPCIIVLSE